MCVERPACDDGRGSGGGVGSVGLVVVYARRDRNQDGAIVKEGLKKREHVQKRPRKS
jgi:hypothetical protein